MGSIFEKKELNFTPIFLIGNTFLLGMLLIISISSYGQLNQLKSKSPTLVELNDGTSIRVSEIGDKNRSAKAIISFTGTHMTSLFSWNVLPKTIDNSNVDKNLDLDEGVEIGDKKVTTNAWISSFALSEDFREEFLKEVSELTPPEIFTGNMESALIVRHISQPLKIDSGKWSVNLVANLVFFENGDEVNKAISFNKKIFIRAVDTPALPKESSSVQQSIYQVRKAGMEIFKIQDLKLG